jgi:hypothetical protein
MCSSLPPPSAAAERVFSLFSNNFDETQHGLLSDAHETGLMLMYNDRNPEGFAVCSTKK